MDGRHEHRVSTEDTNDDTNEIEEEEDVAIDVSKRVIIFVLVTVPAGRGTANGDKG